MITKYEASTDQRIEVTQDYFDELQNQFGSMLIHYSANCPEKYKEFCEEYKNRKKQNV